MSREKTPAVVQRVCPPRSKYPWIVLGKSVFRFLILYRFILWICYTNFLHSLFLMSTLIIFKFFVYYLFTVIKFDSTNNIIWIGIRHFKSIFKWISSSITSHFVLINKDAEFNHLKEIWKRIGIFSFSENRLLLRACLSRNKAVAVDFVRWPWF